MISGMLGMLSGGYQEKARLRRLDLELSQKSEEIRQIETMFREMRTKEYNLETNEGQIEFIKKYSWAMVYIQNPTEDAIALNNCLHEL